MHGYLLSGEFSPSKTGGPVDDDYEVTIDDLPPNFGSASFHPQGYGEEFNSDNNSDLDSDDYAWRMSRGDGSSGDDEDDDSAAEYTPGKLLVYSGKTEDLPMSAPQPSSSQHVSSRDSAAKAKVARDSWDALLSPHSNFLKLEKSLGEKKKKKSGNSLSEGKRLTRGPAAASAPDLAQRQPKQQQQTTRVRTRSQKKQTSGFLSHQLTESRVHHILPPHHVAHTVAVSSSSSRKAVPTATRGRALTDETHKQQQQQSSRRVSSSGPVQSQRSTGSRKATKSIESRPRTSTPSAVMSKLSSCKPIPTKPKLAGTAVASSEVTTALKASRFALSATPPVPPRSSPSTSASKAAVATASSQSDPQLLPAWALPKSPMDHLFRTRLGGFDKPSVHELMPEEEDAELVSPDVFAAAAATPGRHGLSPQAQFLNSYLSRAGVNYTEVYGDGSGDDSGDDSCESEDLVRDIRGLASETGVERPVTAATASAGRGKKQRTAHSRPLSAPRGTRHSR